MDKEVITTTKESTGFSLINWLITISLLGLFGCKSEVNISGRLMSDCETPAAYKRIYVKQISSLFGGGHGGSFMTDAEGYFDYTFETRSGAEVRLSGLGVEAERLPVLREIKFGKIVQNYKHNFFFKLNVAYPYTAVDTLYYRVNAGDWREMTGPFVQGQYLDSFPEFYLKFEHFNNEGISSALLEYHINKNSDVIYYHFQLEFCKDDWQEVGLLIY